MPKMQYNIFTFIIVILIVGAIGYQLASLDESNIKGQPLPEKTLYSLKGSRNETKNKLQSMVETKEKLIKDKEKAISEFDKEIQNSESNIKTLEKELQDKETSLQEELKK